MVLSDNGINKSTNIGQFWTRCTKQIFGLSGGYPYGHQAGSVMAMAALGNKEKYYDEFFNHLKGYKHVDSFDYDKYKNKVYDQYDVAAALQAATEQKIKDLIQHFLEKTKMKKLCMSGGVSLNCVMVGKLYEWFGDIVDDIYVDPIPYDAGLTLGSARYLWHHILDNPRIEWKDNTTSYLGFVYPESMIHNTLKEYDDRVVYEYVDDEKIVDLLIEQKIVSVFGKGSESGRRALGNRSILADPRSKEMKAIINDKVKHRQWYRPFAPSVLREHVKDWFIRDINSPYMSFAIPFKEEKSEQVAAVIHFDKTARLQTVTKNDNEWYYNLINKFYEKTGVPILLNTSFNDREPIVEFPEHAIKCFLKTEIDYLYFYEPKILVRRKGA